MPTSSDNDSSSQPLKVRNPVVDKVLDLLLLETVSDPQLDNSPRQLSANVVVHWNYRRRQDRGMRRQNRLQPATNV